MAISRVEASYHAPKRIGRPPTPILPETPVERFEGEGVEISAECVYYRDLDQPERLQGDAGCDDAVRRMERAHANGDDVAFRTAARDYWHHDEIEDSAAASGDGRVVVIHMHAKCLTAMAVETEMSGVPLTTRERLPKLYSRRRRGQRGTGR